MHADTVTTCRAPQPARPDSPQRPIRLLVPSPPGGPSDFAARLIAPKLSEALGQNVVVDPRQSVNGIIATEIAAKSTPDGLTLETGNHGTRCRIHQRLPARSDRRFPRLEPQQRRNHQDQQDKPGPCQARHALSHRGHLFSRITMAVVPRTRGMRCGARRKS